MLFITLVSFAAAVAAVVFAWRVTQEAQRRSDARVALLMTELAAVPSERTSEASTSSAGRDTAGPREDLDAVPPVVAVTAAPSSSVSPTDDTQIFASEDARETRGSATISEQVLVSNLFAQQNAPTTARPVPRWALVLGVAVLVGGGLAAASALSSASGARRSAAHTAASASVPPLELLSLEHEQERDAVAVSGVVRNPATADARQGIAVVVFFFDAQGRPVSHPGAPEHMPLLAPGAEAPFTVRTSLPAGVSRLRVSFRQEDGSAAPHVDRRRAGGTP